MGVAGGWEGEIIVGREREGIFMPHSFSFGGFFSFPLEVF